MPAATAALVELEPNHDRRRASLLSTVGFLSGAALGEEVLSATPLITAGCYTFHRDCDDSNFVPVNVPSAAICSEVLANAKAGP